MSDSGEIQQRAHNAAAAIRAAVDVLIDSSIPWQRRSEHIADALEDIASLSTNWRRRAIALLRHIWTCNPRIVRRVKQEVSAFCYHECFRIERFEAFSANSRYWAGEEFAVQRRSKLASYLMRK